MKYDYLKDSAIRRTFAQVIAHDPESFYANAQIPVSAHNFPDAIISSMGEQFKDGSVAGLIKSAVMDTQTILDAAIEDTPELTRQDALEVVRDPISILAIAELALHDQGLIERYARKPDRNRYFYIHPERKQLLLGGKLPDHTTSEFGCPFAGKGAEADDVIPIDPLFKRFVPWSGSIAVLRYFDTRDTPHYRAGTRMLRPTVS